MGILNENKRSNMYKENVVVDILRTKKVNKVGQLIKLAYLAIDIDRTLLKTTNIISSKLYRISG